MPDRRREAPEEEPGRSKVTTDHETIKRWVEERDGRPATVARTGTAKEPGVLRIDFPGYGRAGSLQPISWDDFFKKFDEKNLAFLYQDRTAGGEISRFCKFVSKDTLKKREAA